MNIEEVDSFYLSKYSYIIIKIEELNSTMNWAYPNIQFDIHPYVIRKTTLSTYFSFLSYVDHVYDHPYYRKAACGALECAVAFATK